MSETAHDSHAHGAHPTERQYWMVFLALFVLTAIEIAWSYIGLEGAALVVPLLVMMVVKFFLVAGAFMHLYFDTKVLNGKIYWIMFAFGLVIALLVFLAVFASFDSIF